jgi:hypothetical protein
MAASLPNGGASFTQARWCYFLRDLWARGWLGLIDDSGVPKACYHLKRTLQPLTYFYRLTEGVNGLFAHVI